MNLLLALVFLGICLWLIVAVFIAMPMFLWMDAKPFNTSLYRSLHTKFFD